MASIVSVQKRQEQRESRLHRDRLARENDPVYSLILSEPGALGKEARWKRRNGAVSSDVGTTAADEADRNWRGEVMVLLKELRNRVENIEAAQTGGKSGRSAASSRLKS